MNPIKSIWFWISILFGLSLWMGVHIPQSLGESLIKLPGLFILLCAVFLVPLLVISVAFRGKHEDYAHANIQKLLLYIANLFARSGHSVSGISIVGLAHYLLTFDVGSNMRLFLTGLCVAPAFYFLSWTFYSLARERPSGGMFLR